MTISLPLLDETSVTYQGADANGALGDWAVPLSNDTLILAGTITDDDLVKGSNIRFGWPSASERLNHVTVRFSNEAQEFKEDTVSWPPKSNGAYAKGFLGRNYTIRTGWDGIAGPAMNDYAVWGDTEDTTTYPGFAAVTLTWKFASRDAGDHLLIITADDSATITLDNGAGDVHTFSTNSDWGNIEGKAPNPPIIFTLLANTIYDITIVAKNEVGTDRKGVAAALFDPFSNEVWSTRSTAYQDMVLYSYSDEVYQAMLAEDDGVELEQDIFAEGITDYYHAIAKAEEMVRTSRSAFSVELEYVIKNKYYEPGDFVRIQSNNIQSGETVDFIMRVDEIRVSQGNTAELKGSRFHWTQLAWNVKDEEYLPPTTNTDFSIPAPFTLTYSANPDIYANSSGTLTWTPVQDSRIVGYIIYMYTPGYIDEVGLRTYKEIGRAQPASAASFSLPQLSVSNASFGIRSYTASGKLSRMTTTDGYNTESLVSPVRSVSLVPDAPAFIQEGTSEAFINPTITLTATATNYTTPVYSWYEGTTILTGETNSTLVVSAFTVGESKTYRVQVTDANIPNQNTLSTDAVVLYSVKNGSEGLNAQLISLTVTGYVFGFKDENATSSDSPDITITLNTQNIEGTGTFVATAYDFSNNALGTVTLGGTGNSRTLSYTDFNTYSSTQTSYVRITATLDTLSDSVTIYRLNGGTSTIQGGLSNESHTLAADSAGNVVSYTTAYTVMLIFQGLENVTSLYSFSKVDSNTSSTLSGNGTDEVTVSVTNLSADTGTVTITATRSGYPNIVKVFTVSKSRAGTDGADGSDGSNGANGLSSIYAYKVQDQDLSQPSFSSTTSGANAPSGWSLTKPSVSVGQVLWYINGRYNSSSSTINGVSPNTTAWSGPIAANVFQDLVSDNWNGSTPPTYGSTGTYGTQGYYISRNTGNAYFNNGVFRGDINTSGDGYFGGTNSGSSLTTVVNVALADLTADYAVRATASSDSTNPNRIRVGVLGQSQVETSAILYNVGVVGVGKYGTGGSAKGIGVAGEGTLWGICGTTENSAGAGGIFSNGAGGAAIALNGNLNWGSYGWTPPAGQGKFLRDDGTWQFASGGGGGIGSITLSGGSTGLYVNGLASATLTSDGTFTLSWTGTGGTIPSGNIPDLSAGKITSGTFSVDRIPSLPASQITSGTLASARIGANPGSGYFLYTDGSNSYWTPVTVVNSVSAGTGINLTGTSSAVTVNTSAVLSSQTNSGTANVSSNRIDIRGDTGTDIAGAYVRTSGSGNTVTVRVTTSSPSDARIKHEVTDCDLGLDFIDSLRPVSYKLTEDTNQQKSYGFISQEVQELVPGNTSLAYFDPNVGYGNVEGLNVIYYQAYIAVLTKGMQELNAKVKELELKVQELSNG